VPRGQYRIAYRPENEKPSLSPQQLDSKSFLESDIKDELKTSPMLTSTATAVEITDDLDFEITLPCLFFLEGQVVNAAGQPVTEARVTVVSAYNPHELSFAELGLVAGLKTDLNGKFSLCLEKGTYDIAIEPAKSSELFGIKRKGFSIACDSTESFILKEGFKVKGEVMFEERFLSGCLIRIVSIEHGKEFLTRTDSDGQFTINVPEDTYRLTASAHPKDAPTKKINGMEYAGLAPWSGVINVKADTNLVIKLQEGTGIHGRVADEAGNPRPGIEVSVFFDSEFNSQAGNINAALTCGITDGGGNYCFFLRPGRYWLAMHGDFAKAKTVDVGAETVKFDVTWQGWCQLSFEVVGEDGKKIDHCRLRYSPYALDRPQFTDDDRETFCDLTNSPLHTNGDGICRVTLPVGIYTFAFMPASDSLYGSKIVRQLSLSADLTRKVVLPVRSQGQIQPQVSISQA